MLPLDIESSGGNTIYIKLVVDNLFLIVKVIVYFVKIFIYDVTIDINGKVI